MTKKEKKQIMELIDTIQSAMCTLRTVIEKEEETSVPSAVTVSKTESDSTLREIDERMVKKLLKELGVPVNIKGYRYICNAVVCLSKEKEMKISLGLYPKVAKEFGTTGSRVERAIRHAVERTFETGSYEMLDEIFGETVRNNKGKVTNSEFLYTCVEYLEDKMSH